MKTDIKEISKLEKDVVDNLSGKSPVIVLDTGALIDISNATRKYDLVHRIVHHKRGGENPNYFDAVSFLKYFSGMAPLIITPRTHKEIYRHASTRLNGHTFELPLRAVEFSLDNMVTSTLFLDGLQGELPKDETRYDTYWTSKECCNGNHKKQEEGCSDTDKEILEAVAYLSSGRTVRQTGEKVDQVIILSSDAHVISGAEFLKRGFDGRYQGIVPISTRC